MTKENKMLKKNKKLKKSSTKKSTDKYPIINDFTNNNVLTIILNNDSIFNYKIILYWAPILLWAILIIFILTVTDYNPIENPQCERMTVGLLTGACLGFVLMFVIYFLIDLYYQNKICNKLSFYKKMENAFINSLYHSIFILIAYVLSGFLRDCTRSYCNSQFGTADTKNFIPGIIVNTIRFKEVCGDWKNVHRNNIIVSILFYWISLFLRNPLNKPGCSGNKIC